MQGSPCEPFRAASTSPRSSLARSSRFNCHLAINNLPLPSSLPTHSLVLFTSHRHQTLGQFFKDIFTALPWVSALSSALSHHSRIAHWPWTSFPRPRRAHSYFNKYRLPKAPDQPFQPSRSFPTPSKILSLATLSVVPQTSSTDPTATMDLQEKIKTLKSAIEKKEPHLLETLKVLVKADAPTEEILRVCFGQIAFHFSSLPQPTLLNNAHKIFQGYY